MDRLWAPWRSKYIYDRKKRGCIFCISKLNRRQDDKSKFIVERSKYCFSILNRFPYNNGHIMIAPYRHVKSPELLTDIELADLMKLVNRSISKLKRSLKPHGFNIGMNIGRTAGAGFSGHIHMHIVPRWNGDTNFMPVLGNPKVIAESLESLYNTLKK